MLKITLKVPHFNIIFDIWHNFQCSKALNLWLSVAGGRQQWCYILLNKWVVALLGKTVGVLCLCLTFVSDYGVYPTLTNSKLLCVFLYAFMSHFLQAFPVIYLMTACNVIALTGAELKEVHGGSHLTCWREPLCLFVLRIIILGLNWSSYWTWLWVPLFIQCTTLLKIRAGYHSYSWRFTLNH